MTDWKTVQEGGLRCLEQLMDSIPFLEASPLRRDSWTAVDALVPVEHPLSPGEDMVVLFRVEGLNPQGQAGVYEIAGVGSLPGDGAVEAFFNGLPACVHDYETPTRRPSTVEDWIGKVARVTAHASTEEGGLPSIWAGEDVGSMLARAELNVTMYSDHGILYTPGDMSLSSLEEILNRYLSPTPVTADVLPVTADLVAELSDSRWYILRHHAVSEGETKVTYPAAAVGPGLEEVWWDRLSPDLSAYFFASFDGQQLSAYRSDCAVDTVDFAAAVAAVHQDAPPRTWTEDGESADWFAVRLDHPSVPSLLVLPNVETGFDLHIDDDGAFVSLVASEGHQWRAEQSAKREYEIRWGRWLCENPVTSPDPAVVSRLLEDAVGELKARIDEEKTA